MLGTLLAGRLAHVNLIPLNPTPGSKWTATEPAVQREFVRRLEAHGVPVTVRDTRGREIDGACGQLAASAAVTQSGTVNPASVNRSDPLRWRLVHWGWHAAQRAGVVTAGTPAAGGSPRSAPGRWPLSRPGRCSASAGSPSGRTP